MTGTLGTLAGEGATAATFSNEAVYLLLFVGALWALSLLATFWGKP